jgi:hypothetical protein
MTNENAKIYAIDVQIVKALNAEIHNVNSNPPKMTAPVEDHVAWNARRRELRDTGEKLGFIRIFDNSFKLNMKVYE